MNPIKSSLRYPTVTVILTVLMVIVGLRAFFDMQRTEDPQITIRTGLVIALYPGATSEQVEKQVTKTLEKHIFKFPEVRKGKTYSTSRPGLVVINVELEDNVKNSDLFWSKLRHELIETRATELPDGVRGPIVNSDFGDTVAMLIAVHGKRYGYRELRDYVDRIQDELRTVRDVGKLATYGGQSEEVWVTSSLERVSQYFADPVRIAQALQQRNVIEGTGKFDTDNSGIQMRTTGLFTTEDQIRNVLVDVSKTGQPLYIRDFADVERRYQDPTFLVRHDGEPSILLSVEMQKGKNIVQLGEQIDQVFTRLKTLLPPDIKLDLVANQPKVVKARMSGLSHEFMLAIGAVILVTMILLPIRVAVVAALAIPVTLCATLGAMSAMGIALHQVSIAALIVVLGIVVDDAIVIADNYVELLDRKVPRAEAAWRSATDVVVPVFTATVTIVSSFLPLLIITGSVGEFVAALPVTVAIALMVSFIVAVMLTPILCRFFIKKGLHDHEKGEQEKAKKKFSVLDSLQAGYQVLIRWFMGRKRLAVLVGVIAFVSGIVLFSTVREQFFPSAERNQFVIDVWTLQGSRIESTDAVMRRIENRLAEKSDVVHYATFVGQSAPRFYYNVNPQQPDPAYGQFIVNTKSVEATSKLVGELRAELPKLTPEALVIVKELQQGAQMEAPVEVRISGDDIAELKRLGSQVQAILSSVPFSLYVHRDFFNDSCMLDVDINNELANRLGITNSSVSRILKGAFDGWPVSTFWEGDRPVTIMFRLDQQSRSSFSGIRNAYMTSQLTNARVPLRSIAALDPEWQTSRIVRRNGVRTITVRAFVKQGWYGSDLLKKARPKIEALRLPLGYRIEYGGEKDNRDETFPQMIVALGISLLAIFLVMLVQFRNITEPLVVMSSIPLALLGAALGLVITRNPFGFTAFLGMISLTGIVVRNAIILVDYIKERLAEGETLEQAATDAGARRLRPIFLTSMAAAVGVTPMILSGSSLWSPLASVVAVGLICSMFFTLLVVPVLYVLVRSRSRKSATQVIAVLAILILFGAGQASAERLKLTLPAAIDLARRQNRTLKISKEKIEEKRQRIVSARSKYFPQLSNETQYMGLSDKQLVTIPAGSLGTVPGLGPFPTQDMKINQGSSLLFISNTTLTQPLTQLFKINEGHEVAKADRAIAESEAQKTEDEIVFSVHQLYYGLLIAQKQKEAAKASLTAAQEGLRESSDAVKAGNALDVALTQSKVQLLQNRQALISADIQTSDLTSEMNDLLGLPLDTELVLAEIEDALPAPQPFQKYLQDTLSRNPELQAAKESVAKAGHAVKAARDEYIPDISLFARHLYQNGAPFVSDNIGVFGAQMTWNIFDWGNRRGVVGERKSQLAQAEENVKRIEERLNVEITKAYRKLEQTRTLVDVTSEALELQRENQRLSADRLKAGTITAAGYAESVAAVSKAESDDLQAKLGYRLALADVDRISGGLSH
ncbi:MAG TPA: efflux RND transporter permease subunit [Geobacteraceae bacterium]|nr:efflux RND transporter permease subunit [Geobacteraceae bacterium]